MRRSVFKKKKKVYCWILRVMYSCTTKKQLITSEKLIRNYATMFSKDDFYLKLGVRWLLLNDELTISGRIK